MKWFKILILVLLVSLLAACTAISTPTPTVAPTKTITPTETIIPTKTATPTPTRPALPAGVGDLKVYNYETGKDEVLSPIFDQSTSTWVWKNENGGVRRFLDIETGHIFAQTETSYDQLIYQVDKDFGWEADLTETIKFTSDKKYNPIASAYLGDINAAYPGVVNRFNQNTKLILKIVHGGYDDIKDKSKVSSSKDPGHSITGIDFLWPYYDEKNNTYTLTMYLHKDYLTINEAIRAYTGHMLNYCPTANPYEKATFGVVNCSIPKKSIQ